MTREEILESAVKQFNEKGLKFTMLDVAQDLHIAKKSIYVFYESKEELLIAMLDDGFTKIQEKKRKILTSELSMEEKIRKVMIAMPDQYSVMDFRELSSLKDKYPKVYACLQKHLEADWEPVIQLLEDGIKTNHCKKISIPILRMMITSSFEQFLSTDDLKNEGIPYTEALENMMDILMKGIMNHENNNQ